MSLLCLKTSLRLLDFETPYVPSEVPHNQDPASIWAFSHWLTPPSPPPHPLQLQSLCFFPFLELAHDLSFLNFTLFICSNILLPRFSSSFSQNIMLLSKLNFIANAELDVLPVSVHSILHLAPWYPYLQCIANLLVTDSLKYGLLE